MYCNIFVNEIENGLEVECCFDGVLIENLSMAVLIHIIRSVFGVEPCLVKDISTFFFFLKYQSKVWTQLHTDRFINTTAFYEDTHSLINDL